MFPLTDTAAMVNLDMVGRLLMDDATGKGKLIVEGTGTAKSFDDMIEKLNPGFILRKRKGGLGPSDHDSFYRKNIPVIFLWNDTHKDYHKPSDTAEKINVGGMRQITDFAEKVIVRLATDEKRPEYVRVASTFTPGAAKGPKLGIMPGYDEAREGVLVDGVSDNGPAAQAGIKAGDLIIEVAGKQVKNIGNYMVIMGQQESGRMIEITVLRNGEKLTLKATPK